MFWRAFGHLSAARARHLRPFYTYGAYQRRLGVVISVMTRASCSLFPVLLMYCIITLAASAAVCMYVVKVLFCSGGLAAWGSESNRALKADGRDGFCLPSPEGPRGLEVIERPRGPRLVTGNS